ncbi:uncharacterized protein LOC102361873 [Latimeria chalumnae]|uniref:uncharacterized protein LOC102361873 n=1 Tax=Latimeria chalumnae TaxID=7897 RepID=UPI00313AEE96
MDLKPPIIFLCSNAAYILGSVAENELGALQLVALAQRHTSESWHLLGTLSAMLKWEDTEAVMNAAGTLGTLAETSEGLQWLLSDPHVNEITENITALLDSANEWTVSNAALVLARVTISELGCKKLLGHPRSQLTLRKLIACIKIDEAGCGMNAAFALGRLCDTDDGRRRIMSMTEATNMIIALENMMANGDAGGSRNACFALSCLATDKDGHAHVLRSSVFPQMLDTLCRLLQSEDQESAWFAAMYVDTNNEIKLPRTSMHLYDGNDLLYKGSQCSYILPDVKQCRKYKFKLLLSAEGDASPCSDPTVLTVEESVPSCPLDFRVLGCTTTQLKLSWSPPAEPRGVIKCYILYKEDILIESTTELSCIVTGLTPSTSYSFSICACTVKGKGEKSSLIAKTADPGDHAPSNLTLNVLGRNEIFITWDMPEVPLGRLFNFELYMNGKVVYFGPDRSFTARRLSVNTEYTCTVTAITSEGKCESKPVTKRTAKDEYESKTKSLYFPVRTGQLSSSVKEQPESTEKVTKPRAQPGIHKEQPPMKTPKAHLVFSKGMSRVSDTEISPKAVTGQRKNSSRSCNTEPNKSPTQSAESRFMKE